jgi:triosephosphate isomerase
MVFGASRQPGRFLLALGILVLSFASWTTAFVVDSRAKIQQSRGDIRWDYHCGVLNSFNRHYLDFGNIQNDNARGPTQVPTSGAVETSGSNNDRIPIIAGNWKLNPSTIQEASTLLNLLGSNFYHHRTGEDTVGAVPEVIVFPPFPFLERAVSLLEGTGIKVGAQNVGIETKGAFTGEVSPSMVRSLGCDFVMVGHSERRTLFGESDDIINSKIKLSLQEPGLKIILCVGETLEEYENELLSSVVNFQIKKALKGITKDDIVDAVAIVPSTRLVIAYEPVWAIGTGKVATPEQAQVAHAVVRNILEELYGSDIAGRIQLQYGGSVTPDSISDLIRMPDVDGALVGGASLTADGFTRIVDGAAA